MTCSSGDVFTACGTGGDGRGPPRASNRLSSALTSSQTPTHPSQTKTVGPAISLRTSLWSLLQNQQRSISPSPAFLTIGSLSRPLPYYGVNNPECLALVPS